MIPFVPFMKCVNVLSDDNVCSGSKCCCWYSTLLREAIDILVICCWYLLLLLLWRALSGDIEVFSNDTVLVPDTILIWVAVFLLLPLLRYWKICYHTCYGGSMMTIVVVALRYTICYSTLHLLIFVFRETCWYSLLFILECSLLENLLLFVMLREGLVLGVTVLLVMTLFDADDCVIQVIFVNVLLLILPFIYCCYSIEWYVQRVTVVDGTLMSIVYIMSVLHCDLLPVTVPVSVTIMHCCCCCYCSLLQYDVMRRYW